MSSIERYLKVFKKLSLKNEVNKVFLAGSPINLFDCTYL